MDQAVLASVSDHRPVRLTLPDGSVRAYDRPVSGAELARDIAPSLAKAALAIRIDGEVKDLATVIEADARVAIVTRPIRTRSN